MCGQTKQVPTAVRDRRNAHGLDIRYLELAKVKFKYTESKQHIILLLIR